MNMYLCLLFRVSYMNLCCKIKHSKNIVETVSENGSLFLVKFTIKSFNEKLLGITPARPDQSELWVCCVFKLVDVEYEHEEAQKEISGLRRHLAEVESDLRVKERNFRVTLDEARQTECQLSGDRCRLKQSLDEAGTELIETRLQLSAAEGRVSALESQLGHVDSLRVETQTKLASVVSSLRRFLGLRGGLVHRSRSLSPVRPHRGSPSRSSVRGRVLYLTVDVFDCWHCHSQLC